MEAEATVQSDWSHFTTPGALLAMTGSVGPVPRCAHAVSIPVVDLGLGVELSPIAAIGVDEAVEVITNLIGD